MMKRTKIIRLNESELIRIVRKILNEQENNFDYVFYRDTSIREFTPAQEIYLVKNGETYDVFAKKPDSNIIETTNFTLPMESELSLKWDGSQFVNFGPAKIANQIASLIKTNFERTKGNLVIFTRKNGKPAIGNFGLGPIFSDDILKRYNKTGKKLKVDELYTVNDYVPLKRKRGRSFEVKDVVEAKPSEN